MNGKSAPSSPSGRGAARRRAGARPDAGTPPDAGTANALPAATAGALVLERSLALLAPLVRLLVDHGVGYPAFTTGLKAAFIDAAREQLQEQGARTTDAAISVRSGVHRKEVRVASAALAQASAQPGPGARSERRALSLAEQVFTRWTTDAAYRDRDGRPATLPLGGAAPSFESLATSVTRDVSRRTVLAELVRMGLVEERDGTVVPLGDAVVPKAGFETTLRYLSEHVHDHLAAAAANLGATERGAKPPFLEHSLYANGLSAESIAQLTTMARELWRPSFERMTDAARQRFEIDRAHALDSRLRVGIYVYAEPAAPPEGGRALDAPVEDAPVDDATGRDSRVVERAPGGRRAGGTHATKGTRR